MKITGWVIIFRYLCVALCNKRDHFVSRQWGFVGGSSAGGGAKYDIQVELSILSRVSAKWTQLLVPHTTIWNNRKRTTNYFHGSTAPLPSDSTQNSFHYIHLKQMNPTIQSNLIWWILEIFSYTQLYNVLE